MARGRQKLPKRLVGAGAARSMVTTADGGNGSRRVPSGLPGSGPQSMPLAGRHRRWASPRLRYASSGSACTLGNASGNNGTILWNTQRIPNGRVKITTATAIPSFSQIPGK